MAARVAFRGRTTCSCMAEWLPWYEKWLIKKGVIKRSVDIYQLIGNAAASAGYHRSGAAADIAQSSTVALRGSRNGGAAGFGRTRQDGMMPHQHLVLKGCPHLTAGAKAQIPELEHKGDGLVGSRLDRGPRDGIKWPLRTWQEGIAWFKAELGETKPPTPPPPPPVLDRMDPTSYGPGKNGPHVTWLGERLVGHGFGEFYDIGPGPTWGPADKANVQAFQTANGLADTTGLPDKTTLELLAAEPKVTVPNAVPEFRVLNINVGADYVPGYTGRLDNIEAVREAARASLVFTTESGNYGDGARLNRQFGWGGKRGESFILHGGSVPITTAVHWDSAKYKLVDEGQFETTGTTHRYATWVKLRHLVSDEVFVAGCTHLIPWPIGPNNVRKYDLQRESAMGSFLRKLDGIAAGLPVVAAGDLNGKRSDPYDGPGKAMAKYGFTEAKTAKAVIDRICGKRLAFTEHVILPTRGATDHDDAVAVYVTLDRK